MEKVQYNNNIVQSAGWLDLDSVALSINILNIIGWAASIDYGPVENFIVYFNGKKFSEFKCITGLPSPDVKAVHPNLASAENCRFRLSIVLSPSDAEKVNSSMILVCPIFRGMHGRILAAMTQESMLLLPLEKDVNFIGGGFEIGLEFLGYFINYCNLKSTDYVLDVGCGIGRMAYPLTAYLSEVAHYEGFDIYDRGIGWAKKNISFLYPNFNFQKVNIFNKNYNPRGNIKASEFEFPYEDQYFNFVFLTSIFTHMYPHDVRQYLKEIFRVLKKGSRCLFTCFLLNSESKQLIKNRKSTQKFIYRLNECYTVNVKIPEKAIGFEENLLLQWILDEKFVLQSKLYGNWSGREQFISYQDIIILKKD